MTSYEDIFENNRQWIAQKTSTNADFFKHLAQDQNPDYLYIGCSDSRVTAEELMGLGPGEVFVHRNVANLVNNVDLNVMAVLNYAIRHLKVKHIIVCGHYNCGGVKAAMQPKDLGILNPWLRNIRDVYRHHKAELDAIAGETERFNRLVELNVLEQCTNIIKTAALQLSYQETGFPQVHGWVFDIHTGNIIDLNINFEQILQEIKAIYDLTS
ncbi:carbonic anhydrase [Rufibacter ruber]|uniref:carbonic anhydrase n=1 Tax=Rufibacter ruber TaxID=1783499 RepID=UPI00082F9579|nr:carbonic anhydrase [Rufibacter ruber]